MLMHTYTCIKIYEPLMYRFPARGNETTAEGEEGGPGLIRASFDVGECASQKFRETM